VLRGARYVLDKKIPVPGNVLKTGTYIQGFVGQISVNLINGIHLLVSFGAERMHPSVKWLLSISTFKFD
jgi:hypothetical protein